jgi:hypothetical protein
MPTPGPEQYRFPAYIHYENGDTSKPQVIAYWKKDEAPPTPEEEDILQQHAEDHDVSFTLIVTRTVTENQFRQSEKIFRASAPDAGPAVLSVVRYLEQLHPGEFELFKQACWESARARRSKDFPQSYPGPERDLDHE